MLKKLPPYGYNSAETAELFQLSGAVPWAGNTLSQPEAITPRIQEIKTGASQAKVVVQPYSLVRIRFRPRHP